MGRLQRIAVTRRSSTSWLAPDYRHPGLTFFNVDMIIYLYDFLILHVDMQAQLAVLCASCIAVLSCGDIHFTFISMASSPIWTILLGRR